MHAVRHRYTLDQVTAIAAALDAAGVDAIEIAHGDGLGRLALTYGPGAHTDDEWIGAVAAVVNRARLTTLLLPGIGTIDDLERAHDLGITSVRVATHATEADIAAQHIAQGPRARHGRLRLPHDEPPGPARPSWRAQAKLMESYGAHCVYVTDSGGRLTMDGVRDRVRAYRDVLDDGTEIGIHAHQNLSLAVANSRRRRRERRDPGGRLPRRHGRRRRQLPDRAAHRGGQPAAAGSTAATCSRCKTRPTTWCAAARPPGPGRPGNAHPRLRRRLFQLPPARGKRRRPTTSTPEPFSWKSAGEDSSAAKKT